MQALCENLLHRTKALSQRSIDQSGGSHSGCCFLLLLFFVFSMADSKLLVPWPLWRDDGKNRNIVLVADAAAVVCCIFDI